ncbi:GTPase-associated protein 1-related protein [Saccharopolyspora cebuensis]|uniref:GTPase-associated protein 1-related protein n=1 Tax=Saccharopolyspora cebuensis TaxID=418759 RepID=A0ABV4CG80_9PSEU
MSARDFHSLFYTDCGPGQGTRGTEGFQIQAMSAGTGQEDAALVQRAALYEVPPDWLRERRPVAEFPPSLVHLHDGRYVTARGVYADTEQDRVGNHFTHALVTDDPASYGGLRPAQLWQAPWWAERPVEGTECPPVPAEPEPGPHTAAELRDWVLARDDGHDWLTAVHTALDQVREPDARRVVFVGRHPDEVLRWIAAGTLLLPQERALRIGFRVYATDPRLSRQHVLALHPDWAGELDDGDFVVFHLGDRRRGAIEPSAAARHWVGRFLHGDPAAVVEELELAHRFARQRGAERADAGDRLAAGVLASGEPVPDQQAAMELAGWLVGTRAPEQAIDRVREAVLALPPERAVLARLAETAHDARVRVALLRAELAGAAAGEPVATSHLAAHRWSAEELSDATGLAEETAADTAPEHLDGVLRTAGRFGLEPRPTRFAQAAKDFIAWWAQHPQAPVDPRAWPCRAELIALLREELGSRLAEDSGALADAIREHWWRLLAPTVADPFLPLDRLVAQSAVAAGGEPRQQVIDALRDRTRAAERRGHADAVWEALFAHTPPTVAEVRSVLGAMSATMVSEALAERIFPVLESAPASADQLDVLRMLVHHLGSEHEGLRSMWEDDSALRAWLANFQRAARAPGAGVGELKEIADEVLTARGPEIVAALLSIPPPTAASAAVAGGARVQELLVRELPAVWADEQRPAADRTGAVALAFLTAWSDKATEGARVAFDKALEAWAKRRTSAEYRKVSKLLRGVDADSARAWHDWLKELFDAKPKSTAARLAERWRTRWTQRKG